MDILEIIDKKANKLALSREEIEFFVDGYTNGKIADYQASALLMAIKINGMTNQETFDLTDAMLRSGSVMDLSSLGFVVDKHSTGGVSDTTTIAIAPICACLGVKMLKLCGRGLGFTGGTIDKLEAFTGYKADVTMEQSISLVQKNNACIISATKDLAPADKKIYALRDITGTVESLPLIASSVMSKKLASGANAIVLDVKYGDGAFMKDKRSAIKLAKLMVQIGENAGKKMDYYIDDMNEPLGYNIGNRLEAYEAIEVLSGKKGELYDVTVRLAAKCVSLGKNISYAEAKKLVKGAISSGKALEKLKVMIKAQGGNTSLFFGLNQEPTLKIYAQKDGVLNKIHCARLGRIVGLMGATRQKITDSIDYNVGIKTFHKLGCSIKKGDLLFEVYAKDLLQAQSFKAELLACYEY